MEQILFYIGLIGLLLATITDLRSREVPDLLNYILLASGLGIRLLYSINTADFFPLVHGLIGVVIGFAIGAALFYSGQWGGGDAKMLMALGALFGTFGELQLYFMPVLIFNIFLAGAIYGVGYLLFALFRYPKKIFPKIKEISQKRRFLRIIVYTIVGILLVLSVFSEVGYLYWGASAIILFLFIMSIISKAVELNHMIRTVPISLITEGEWIYEPIYVKGKPKPLSQKIIPQICKHFAISQSHATKVLSATTKQQVKTILKDQTKEYIEFIEQEYNYKFEYRYICGPHDMGISKEQLFELQKTKLQKITIKVGAPFIPAFLLGLILTIIIGSPVEIANSLTNLIFSLI